MPFVFKFSGLVLLLSFVAGQFWLHDDATAESAASAREALAECSSLRSERRITSQWDVVRTHDAVLIQKIAGFSGLGKGC